MSKSNKENDVQKLPEVAVLMAAFNGEKYIDEQLQSILSQQINVDIYISVDVSSDNTLVKCLDYQSQYNNIYVLPYGEKFGDAASNFFRLIKDVDINKYRFVSLADQDDLWMCDKLKHACDTIEQNKLDALSSDVIAFWQDGRERLIKKSQPLTKLDYLFESAGPGCSFVLAIEPLIKFKKELFVKEKLLKKIALHDWLIYAFFRRYGYKWLIDKEPKMYYRQHALNQVGANRGCTQAIKRFKLIKKRWYRQQIDLISQFINEQEDNKIYLSRWRLILKVNQTRRKVSDRFLFLLMVILRVF